MKFKIKKNILDFIIILIIAINCRISTLAATGDTQQSIHIESDMQSLNMQGNIVSFVGNVVVTQGTIKINADKVIVTRPNNKQGKEFIDGYGNPTNFYQTRDDGKSITGHALKIHYDLAKDLIILNGDAYLEQFNSNIKSDKIIYLVKAQKMQAYSEKGKHVTTVLVPPKLKERNNKNNN